MVTLRTCIVALAVASFVILTAMPVLAIEDRDVDRDFDIERHVSSGCDEADGVLNPCSSGDDLTLSPTTVLGTAPTPTIIFLAGYSRFDDSDPLHHDARGEIHDAINAEPGVYVNKLQSVTEMPRSTLRYHLKILEREGLVNSEKILGTVRYYPSQTQSDELAIALERDATASVLRGIARHEPVSVSGLADVVDRSPSTVHYHLDRLSAEGLIERERDGESVKVSLHADARTALQTETLISSPAD